MGGRGSSSRSASVRAPASPAAVRQAPAQPPQLSVQAQPPNLTPVQGTRDLASVQAMTPAQFARYLDSMTDQKNPMPGILLDGAVQRMVYDTGLNGLPTVVDDATFAKLPGTTLYRSVNAAYDKTLDVNHPADQIARQTISSGLSRLGGGVSGDGFYFDTSPTISSYGNKAGRGKGDPKKTVQMQAKLNGNAKVVSKSKLRGMLRSEPGSVRQAVARAINTESYTSSSNGLTAYALYKGYNVIAVGQGYHVVVDRSALTFRQTLDY